LHLDVNFASDYFDIDASGKEMAKDTMKRGPGRPPTGLRPTTGVRLYEEMEARIDRWIAQQDELDLGRHEAIRRLLDFALEAQLKPGSTKPKRKKP
jgi:hypothetical protein